MAGRANWLTMGAILLAATGGAAAQDSADFYKGKTITIIVGFGVGGGYDSYARLIAGYLGKYIPGQPRVIVQNMEGAGSVRAANYVNAAAPKDGTVIASVVQDLPLHQLLGATGLQFDASRFNWLGGIVSSNSVLYTWHNSGITKWQDARTREVVLGVTGTTSGSSMVPRAVNALLNTKFRLVPGYSGTREIHLAMQRGEMMGAGGSTWAGLTTTDQAWIANKLINLLIQTGPRKEADLPDVPLFSDLVTTEEAKRIVALVSLPAAIGYAYWVAPEVPPARVALLRSAYDATIRDPEFLADAAQRRLLIRPRPAAEVTALVAHAAATPKPTLERTTKILGW